MSTLTSHQQASPLPRIASILRRHPVASFLVLAHVGLWTSVLPILFLDAPPRPLSAVGALVGLALPAFAVTAATAGREGVRDLLHRSLRWRVAIRWYVLALFAIPLGTLAVAPFVAGTPLGPLADQSGALLWAFSTEIVVALVTVQLFEEIGWLGFAQHTLQARHGALKASLLLAPAFGLVHLPFYFIGAPITVQRAGMVLAQMLMVIPFAVFLRALLAWMYNRTAASVLLGAILHASFNTASGSAFLERLGPPSAVSMLPLAAVVLLALAVGIRTKARLGFAGEGGKVVDA